MPKSTSTCHSNRSIFALGQASCSPSGRIHHTHRMPNPHFARFSPGPFGTSSLMDLMGNSPQGEDTPPLEIGEQLTTKAVNAARRRGECWLNASTFIAFHRRLRHPLAACAQSCIPVLVACWNCDGVSLPGWQLEVLLPPAGVQKIILCFASHVLAYAGMN